MELSGDYGIMDGRMLSRWGYPSIPSGQCRDERKAKELRHVGTKDAYSERITVSYSALEDQQVPE
jgi:hypothetical protein